MERNGMVHVELKVVLVGDSAVGKTSLARRFAQDQFHDTHNATVGGVLTSRSIFVADKRITFHLWDTAGTERFKSIVPFYLRDADLALIVYDVCDKISFSELHNWMRLLNKSAPENIKCALVGNKTDLNDLRHVSKEEAMMFAEEHGLHFAETSAKTGDGVKQLFADIGASYFNAKSKPAVVRSTVNVTDTTVSINTRNSCC